MVRTLKARTVRSVNKGERVVLLPGPTGAELWEAWIFGAKGAAECVQVCARLGDNRLRKKATLALPLAQVYGLPLWLNETDTKQFRGMILLQLEMRGLQPRSQGSVVFDYSIVAREEKRTLVLVGVLPALLPDEIQVGDYEAFDLSVRYFPLAENSMMIWREQDQLVVALTRGRDLVYYQALGQEQVTQRTLQDLNTIKASLVMQGILLPLQQVLVWTDIRREEITALQAGLRLPVQQGECPTPVVPSSVWRLTPAAVTEAKKNQEVQRWRYRGMLLGLAIYILVVAVMVTRFFVLSYKVNELLRWQSGHAQAIALVHDTRAAWKNLRPVVDEDNYPLELLLHCAESLPADQLHLTLFEAGDDHLLIKGEAKNVAAAFQFLDKLKRDPHFAGYTWEMAQPHLLPNDLAQLQIEGTHAAAN